MVFPKPKPITLEIRRGWGRGFLCSSLPNHDSKSIEEKENKKQNKNQGQTALERVRAKIYHQITIYMMDVMNAYPMHALMHKNFQFLNIYQKLT